MIQPLNSLVFILLAASALENYDQGSGKSTVAESEAYFEQNHKGVGTYIFGYNIEDASVDNIQFRQEERFTNGTVAGSYGYVNPDGKPIIVTYVSDANGYRVKTEEKNSRNESNLNL